MVCSCRGGRIYDRHCLDLKGQDFDVSENKPLRGHSLWKFGQNEDGSTSERAEKKSPGRRGVVPYTNSAEVHDQSSFRVAQIPQITIGCLFPQSLSAKGALSAPLKFRWKRPTNPLAWGRLYSLVWWRVMFGRIITSAKHRIHTGALSPK